jgi:hypothetical protein
MFLKKFKFMILKFIGKYSRVMNKQLTIIRRPAKKKLAEAKPGER